MPEELPMFSSADKLTAPPIIDPTIEGAERLFIRVIGQALEDHETPSRRREVDAFFSGPAFARYCAMLGWNRDWARRRIQSSMIRGRQPRRKATIRGAQYEV
jgi:hypothetical protein